MGVIVKIEGHGSNGSRFTEYEEIRVHLTGAELAICRLQQLGFGYEKELVE